MMINYREKYSTGLGLIKSPLDDRDYNFQDLVPMTSAKIPDNYMSDLPPFIYDQGTSSMCCACSYNTIRYMQERAKEQSALTEPLSPCFTYGNRKDGQDYEGMLLRECCKKGRDGSILFTELPYFCSQPKAKKYVNERKDQLLKMAKPFGITNFYTAKTKSEIQIAIMETQAVLAGIPVYKCFYTPTNGEIIYSADTCGESDGGHAQAFFGWKTDSEGKLWFASINSWGKEWGNGGFCWIPEDYPLMDDVYVIVDDQMDIKFTDYKRKFYGGVGQ